MSQATKCVPRGTEPGLLTSEILSIVPSSSVVFVTPYDDNVEQRRLFGKLPPGQALISGEVTLHLRKPRTIKRLCVELISKQYLVINACAFTYGKKHCATELVAQSKSYSAGTHTFPFALVLPAKAASSDISFHGRTMNRLFAVVEGAVPLGRKVHAEAPLNIVSQHYDPTGLPPSFSLESDVMHDKLGLIEMQLLSNYLMVSGFASLHLCFKPFSRVKLHNVQVNIVQQTELIRLDHPVKSPILHTDVIGVWRAVEQPDALTDRLIEEGEEYKLATQMRMPDESSLLPTTPDPAESGLRIYHRIEVVVEFSQLVDGKIGDREQHTVSASATISSCRCTLEALRLPVYEEAASVQEAAHECLCEMSQADAIQAYGLDLGAAMPALDTILSPHP